MPCARERERESSKHRVKDVLIDDGTEKIVNENKRSIKPDQAGLREPDLIPLLPFLRVTRLATEPFAFRFSSETDARVVKPFAILALSSTQARAGYNAKGQCTGTTRSEKATFCHPLPLLCHLITRGIDAQAEAHAVGHIAVPCCVCV
jgi:hypothetical protein